MITERDWIGIIVGLVIFVLGGYLSHVFSSARQRIEEKFLQVEKKLAYIEEIAEQCKEDLAVNNALDRERKELNGKIETKLEKIEEKLNLMRHG